MSNIVMEPNLLQPTISFAFIFAEVVVTRTDVPEYPEIHPMYSDPWHPHLSTDHSYIYSFPNLSLPPNFNIVLQGLDSGNSILVGFCVPLGATSDEIEFRGRPKPQEIDTYEELLADNSGTGYYWDHEVGIVFRKFQVDLVWDPESRAACPKGDSYDPAWCPQFFIRPEPYTGDTDCTTRAYPKYRTEPL